MPLYEMTSGSFRALNQAFFATLKPGEFSEQAQLTCNVPPGTYRLGLGIRDPWQDRPAVRFANELPVRDGWTLLSDIKVTE